MKANFWKNLKNSLFYMEFFEKICYKFVINHERQVSV